VRKNTKNILNRFYRDFIIKKIPIVIKKCEFYIIKTNFIEFIIKLRYINMDPKKIKTIVNWQDPENVTGLKSFLEFCNYYRRFIIK